MPSLKEIKGHIGSVKSTLKITSAMKLVASAKLRRAQQAVEGMRPYEARLSGMLAALSGEIAACQERGEPVGEVSTLYTTPRPEVRRVAIVAIASNSSLCGGFNANALRLVLDTIDGYRASGVTDITVYSIGRKLADAMRKVGYPSPSDYTQLAEHPAYAPAAALSESLMEAFAEGRFDAVEIIHNHFVSTASQKPVRTAFLPAAGAEGKVVSGDVATPGHGKGEGPAGSKLSRSDDVDDCGRGRSELSERSSPETTFPAAQVAGAGYIVEPDPATAYTELLPQVIRLGLYTALLDSAAAEHAARTIAMQTATDNAEDLLDTLTLEYNKGRQQKITAELLDIVGGMAK